MGEAWCPLGPPWRRAETVHFAPHDTAALPENDDSREAHVRITALSTGSRLTGKWMVAGALAVLAGVVVLISVILAPQADMARLAQLFVNGLITGSILALTGVGATLVFGIQRIANFAHGDYLTFGAYVAFVVNVVLGQNLVVAPLGAMLATAPCSRSSPISGCSAACAAAARSPSRSSPSVSA